MSPSSYIVWSHRTTTTSFSTKRCCRDLEDNKCEKIYFSSLKESLAFLFGPLAELNYDVL
ncbi:hypothetical protein LINGRAHAP2_LOCUS19652 [Linum grandiflorum]